MKDITSSIYTFEDLIREHFLYVDKTEYIWKMVRPGKGMYFFSRPRRFGKSLTISTLKAIFEGKRELFKGLAIYDKPYEWKVHPVIHLDNANCGARSTEELRVYLHASIENIALEHGLKLRGESLATDFQFLIEDISKKAPAVILLDEYDKPILNCIASKEAKEVLLLLREFYSNIKKCEACIRFAFVTGVTKFCHVSLFSDLNNLTDISMNADYATMLGYTQTEFEEYFAEHLAVAESRQSLTHEDFLARIKSWYDGYRFEENAETVYNPVSLADFFQNNGKFSNYWFATGTPSFLMELIRQDKLELEQITTEPVTDFAFGAFEIDRVPALSLMLQAGYLTIKSSKPKYDSTVYYLDFPNKEVSHSFATFLLGAYGSQPLNNAKSFIYQLSDAIEAGNLPKFQRTMESFFAGIPYDVHHKDEANFQNIFFAIFKLLGYNVHAEFKTSDGRIDAVLETEKTLFLFEFKLNKDGTALNQIRRKEYFKPYLFSHKTIILVGVNFDTATGKLSGWEHEQL